MGAVCADQLVVERLGHEGAMLELSWRRAREVRIFFESYSPALMGDLSTKRGEFGHSLRL